VQLTIVFFSRDEREVERYVLRVKSGKNSLGLRCRQ
jgi:hypothetical protein